MRPLISGAGEGIRTLDVQLGKLNQTAKIARKKRNSCERCAPVAQNLPQSDPDLAEIERLWGRLPEAVKAGIVAMVKAAGGK